MRKQRAGTVDGAVRRGAAPGFAFGDILEDVFFGDSAFVAGAGDGFQFAERYAFAGRDIEYERGIEAVAGAIGSRVGGRYVAGDAAVITAGRADCRLDAVGACGGLGWWKWIGRLVADWPVRLRHWCGYGR